jgi:hypothetical protein
MHAARNEVRRARAVKRIAVFMVLGWVFVSAAAAKLSNMGEGAPIRLCKNRNFGRPLLGEFADSA